LSFLKSSTTILTGAGSVENAWRPINRVLGFDRDDTASANIVFSTIVQQLRLYSMLTSPENEQPHLREAFQQQNILLFKKYSEYKLKIAVELEKSIKSGELGLRKEFDSLIKIHCTTEPNVITTNWDDLIQTYVWSVWGQNNWVKFLHGCYNRIHSFMPGNNYTEAHNSFLLPSESSYEPYFPEATKNHLGTSAFTASGTFFFTEKLILYGISLSPLDSELNLFIGNALKNLNEIIIIDPDYSSVFLRLNAIMSVLSTMDKKEKSIKISGIDPRNGNLVKMNHK
jgi:hypothetical protein